MVGLENKDPDPHPQSPAFSVPALPILIASQKPEGMGSPDRIHVGWPRRVQAGRREGSSWRKGKGKARLPGNSFSVDRRQWRIAGALSGWRRLLRQSQSQPLKAMLGLVSSCLDRDVGSTECLGSGPQACSSPHGGMCNLPRAKFKDSCVMGNLTPAWLLGSASPASLPLLFAGRGQQRGAEPPKGAVSRGLSLLLEAGCYREAVCSGLHSQASVAMAEL